MSSAGGGVTVSANAADLHADGARISSILISRSREVSGLALPKVQQPQPGEAHVLPYHGVVTVMCTDEFPVVSVQDGMGRHVHLHWRSDMGVHAATPVSNCCDGTSTSTNTSTSTGISYNSTIMT